MKLKLTLVPLRTILRDKVDTAMLLIFLAVAVMDLAGVTIPIGGYALFWVYAWWAVNRMNYFKYR